MDSMQPDLTQPQPVEFFRRYGWPAFSTVMLAGLGAYELAKSNPVGVAWLAALAVVLGGEWLHRRSGTYLTRADFTALHDAIAGQPPNRWLLDRDTDDVLEVRRQRFLLRTWRITRFSNAGRIVAEVTDDLDEGRFSTIPYATFLIRKDQITALDHVKPVCVGDGGLPEPYGSGRPSVLADLWFRIRTRAMQVDRAEVVALIAQLPRDQAEAWSGRAMGVNEGPGLARSRRVISAGSWRLRFSA